MTMLDSNFINEWQELIGAALGPFLAVILSAIGFWIKSVIEDKKERKEFLRRIEISLARSLNDIFTAREQLRWFSSRVKNLAAESRSITDDKVFFLNRVNFPTMREIYRDIDMPNFKVKSYYLHNKIMWVDAGTKEMNEVVLNLKSDFEDLIRQNELLVAVMRNSPNPKMQRSAYEQNLESFANAIDDFTSKSMGQGIEIMTQVKIYNEKLRRRNGHLFLWKQEGTKFKFFRNKKEQKAFARNLDSLDRIDKVIEKEVQNAITNAEDRAKKLVHT
ncbi:hypothetical protein EPN83_00370 [Patescibacteria group bacterium]|nr:MAG: hypothetical protein EPN83_00370 [Patescibacteria group bacterium]